MTVINSTGHVIFAWTFPLQLPPIHYRSYWCTRN